MIQADWGHSSRVSVRVRLNGLCVCLQLPHSLSHQWTDGGRIRVVPLPGPIATSPDPAPSIDGSKLALNPRVHSVVPKACQLAETKPFVQPLNPTDGEMDRK